MHTCDGCLHHLKKRKTFCGRASQTKGTSRSSPGSWKRMALLLTPSRLLLQSGYGIFVLLTINMLVLMALSCYICKYFLVYNCENQFENDAPNGISINFFQ